MRKDFPGEYNQLAVSGVFSGFNSQFDGVSVPLPYAMVKSKSNLIPGINSEAKP